MIASYRRVALRLHSLNKHDRNWMISNFPGKHREKIIEMLNELKEIGIPDDFSYENELSSNSDYVENKNNKKKSDEYKQLNRVGSEEITKVLLGESDMIIIALMATKDWSWKDGVIKALGPGRSFGLEEKSRNLKNKLPEKVSRILASHFLDEIEIDKSDYSGKKNEHDNAIKPSSGSVFGIRRFLWRR